MSQRRCSMAGCMRKEVVGVGPLDEPMCMEHYDAWLRATRGTIDRLLDLMKPKEPAK